MNPSQPFLTLEATTFNKDQLDTQLALLAERHCPQIALAGRSNVGKSSLINALAGRKKLAKISATPGKTRSINFYSVQPGDFCLVDLPGYGYARCSQEERRSWAKLIERYIVSCPDLVALALLLDCRLPPQALDRELADFARSKQLEIIPVLTKADKCNQTERVKRQKEWAVLLDGCMPLPVSAVDGRGLDNLWSALHSKVRLADELNAEPDAELNVEPVAESTAASIASPHEAC